VKFLIDECLSRRLSSLLSEAGWDVVHVSERDLLGRPDTEVLACALEEGRVLISADTDFGELLMRSKASQPSVILLRRGSHDADDQLTVLLNNIPGLVDDLVSGVIAVITDDRIRVRPLTR
jgi:predicted nuclease of predicted toxin-antitoxin system